MNKAELLSTLQDSNQRVLKWFTEIPANKFFNREVDAWSASDNLDHLIKSHQPLAKALRLPLVALKGMFGSPNQPSRGYEALCEAYRDLIAKGGVASGSFLPEQNNPVDLEASKSNLLNQFQKASGDVVSAAEKWGDEELDGYLLPHPLLGKLTIREMLYFTIYHNLRHASEEGD
jgi:uncharacterized damage-inducible protein DinB